MSQIIGDSISWSSWTSQGHRNGEHQGRNSIPSLLTRASLFPSKPGSLPSPIQHFIECLSICQPPRRDPEPRARCSVPPALSSPATPVGMGRWHWGCQQLQCNVTNPVMELCTDQGQPCNRVGCSAGSQRNVSDKQKGPECLPLHVGENKWLTRGRK